MDRYKRGIAVLVGKVNAADYLAAERRLTER